MRSTPTEQSSVPTRSGRSARWLLAVAIAGSALAVGTVHTVTLCVVTGVLAVAAVLAWWDGEPTKPRPVATLLLVTGAVLTGYTAVQCVPLPVSWLSHISPHSADVWSRALAPLHEAGPRWAPISLDPGATRVEVLKGVAYLLAFVAALRVARRRQGVTFLSACIVATGLTLAVAALLHPAFGAHKVFGLYDPGPGIHDRHIAPLLNANNLAGYLNVALCLALAATLAPDPRVPRVITGAVTVFLAATQVWVASRGGVITMVLGAAIVAMIVWRAQTRRHAATLSVATGLVAAAGAALLVLGRWDEVSDKLLDTNASKLSVVREAFRMVPAMPFFGCGRGAFESAFPAFRTSVGYYVYSHPENVVAQWLTEWGLPFGLGGLLAIAFALRPNAALARSTTAAGAWAGLVALALQNLVDLGTEVPGLMMAGVVCAAIVVGGTAGSSSRWRVERWGLRSTRVALTAGAAAVAALALAATALGAGLQDDQRAMRDAALDRHTSVDAMHAMARAAMLRHPAEPYLPFAAALRASYQRDENAIPWIGATLERANVYAQAHLVLARVVARRSPSQGRLECRLAMEQGIYLTPYVMDVATHLVDGFDDAMEMVPSGPEGVVVLEHLVPAVPDGLPATRVMLDAEYGARAPAALGPQVRAARAAVEDLEAPEPWCEGEARKACVALALDRAQRVQRAAPRQCDGYALRARTRVANGEVAAGLADLQRAADTVADRVTCLEQLATVARRAGDQTRAEATLESVVNAGCADAAECSTNLRWVANEEEASGHPRKALSMYKRAYERTPDDDALLEHIAALAAGAGLHAEAAEDYERLARRHPGPAWTAAAQRERDAAMRAAIQL